MKLIYLTPFEVFCCCLAVIFLLGLIYKFIKYISSKSDSHKSSDGKTSNVNQVVNSYDYDKEKRSLILRNIFSDQDCEIILSFLEANQNILSLKIDTISISLAHLKLILAKLSNTNIKRLIIKDVVFDESALLALGKISSLNHLTLVNNKIDQAHSKVLESLGFLKGLNLEKFDFIKAQLGVGGVEQLAKNFPEMTRLKRLNFSCNHIGIRLPTDNNTSRNLDDHTLNKVILNLANFLSKFPKLEYLDLSGNQISSQAMDSLKPTLLEMKDLQSLVFRANESSYFVQEILPQMPNLRLLDLGVESEEDMSLITNQQRLKLSTLNVCFSAFRQVDAQQLWDFTKNLLRHPNIYSLGYTGVLNLNLNMIGVSQFKVTL